MTGRTVAELAPEVEALPKAERNLLLCSACSIYDQIAHGVPERLDQLDLLLATNCRYYREGEMNCSLHALADFVQLA